MQKYLINTKKKYIDYIKFRDENFKRYNIRYSGYSPNFESGAINFKLKKNLKAIENNALFFIVDFSESEQNLRRNIITLPYFKSILREGKVYFMRIETIADQNKNQLFEEVKFQKYLTD